MTHLCDSCLHSCKEYGTAIISCPKYTNFMRDYKELKKRVKRLEDARARETS